jgi:pSer/pThr/pTyr-binding forkhead associated (FHA) protein
MSPQLFAVKGPLHGHSFPIENQPVSLGRGSTNSILVDDKVASRQHAEIHHEARGYVLYDLHSSNGTKVNGQPIQSHVLENGDVIVIGEQTFVFQEHGPAQRQHEQPQELTLPQQYAPPQVLTPPQPPHSPYQQQYAPSPHEPENSPLPTFAGDLVPQPALAPPQPVLAQPAPVAQPQGAAATQSTQSTISRASAFGVLVGGVLLIVSFFMPYIVFTVPLGNVPLIQLDDVVLVLSSMQIIQAMLGVNSLFTELTAGLPSLVRDAVEPLIEQPLSDIRANMVWFVLPPIGSLLAGIWYILAGGTAVMGGLAGRRTLLNLMRIISFISSVLVVLALGNAYLQRSNILDVSNIFIGLASGFWVMLAGIVIATFGVLFIHTRSPHTRSPRTTS